MKIEIHDNNKKWEGVGGGGGHGKSISLCVCVCVCVCVDFLLAINVLFITGH